MGKLSLIDQYAKDGYVIVRDVIDQDLVAEARSHIEWLIEKNPDTRPENLDATKLNKRHQNYLN